MKKKKKLPTILLYLLISSFFCSILFISYFNKKLGPGLITCAEDEIKKLTTILINKTIADYTNQNNITQNILDIKRNSDNDIERISYNTNYLNQIKNDITITLEHNLLLLTKGNIQELDIDIDNLNPSIYTKTENGILFTISTGSATGNRLLANIGPKIPLNLSIIGDTTTSIDTNIKEYGLNNTMIELTLTTKVSIVIQMPFLSKTIQIENKIPLSIEIIQGNIPNYYLESTKTT